MERKTVNQYLKALGMVVWKARNSEVHPNTLVTSGSSEGPKDWVTLEKAALSCQNCNLCEGRTQVVFGSGALNARLLIVGEAPGYHEDQQGKPFVGKAGGLLTNMLQTIGLSRETVYITNVVKCRPPNNRDPLPSEIKACSGYLEEQIRLMNPQLILALGRHAAHHLLAKEGSLGELRKKHHVHQSSSVPVVVTYHPAYLLRNPTDKKYAYKDLQEVVYLLKETHS